MDDGSVSSSPRDACRCESSCSAVSPGCCSSDAAEDGGPHLRSRCLDLAFVFLEQLAQHRNDKLQRVSEAGELAFRVWLL